MLKYCYFFKNIIRNREQRKLPLEINLWFPAILSQFCLKLTIFKVHDLLHSNNEKKVAQKIDKPKNDGI